MCFERGGGEKRALVRWRLHVFTAVVEEHINICKKNSPLTKFVQSTRLDEGLERFFIEIPIRNASKKIGDVGKGLTCFFCLRRGRLPARRRATGRRAAMMESATPVPKFLIE